MMNLLKVEGLTKMQDGAFVLKNISFGLMPFRKLAIAGETGSGKSTLLKIIAGIIQPDAGKVLFENAPVEGPAEKLIPGHPQIAYLSQQFELRNNYRVEEILSYANKLPEEEAANIFSVCRISHLLKRRTDQLSGGEKQRIALSRLLIASPTLLLIDEPFSNLDFIHKNILKAVIHDVSTKCAITCLLVSHDPTDTLSWADEIMVMKEGVIVQQGPPEQIYRQPVNEYVAALFGTYNLMPEAADGFSDNKGTEVINKKRFIRPENIKIVAADGHALNGRITKVQFLGSLYELDIEFQGSILTVKTHQRNLKPGDAVHVVFSPDDRWYL